MKYQRFGGFMWKLHQDAQSGLWLADCESLGITLEEDSRAALELAILDALILIGCASKAA